jgi:hypothetical protein
MNGAGFATLLKDHQKVDSLPQDEANTKATAAAPLPTANATHVALGIFSNYPARATITKLTSTFDIKRVWLHSEWAIECQFSKFIRPHFPDRSALESSYKSFNVDLINTVFNNVRGKFTLWQDPKETGHWEKIEVADLSLEWVEKNVKVLYPAKDLFAVERLDGLVLWQEAENGKRYNLIEGNHRISAWLTAKKPLTLPATIFIGKPKAIVLK